VLLGKLLGNLFSKFIAVSAWSNVNDCWFNVNVNVWHSFFKALISINLNTSRITLQERNQCLSLSMIFLYLLRQNTWRNIAFCVLTNFVHSFLADILRAVKNKDVGWSFAVSDEKLGLEVVLRETLKNNSSWHFFREWIYQGHCYFFVTLSSESVLLDEIGEVNQVHVRSFSNVWSYLSFSWSFWTNNKHSLWHNSIFDVVVNFCNVSWCLDGSKFTKVLIVIENRNGLIIKVLNSLVASIRVVINSVTCFASLK